MLRGVVRRGGMYGGGRMYLTGHGFLPDIFGGAWVSAGCLWRGMGSCRMSLAIFGGEGNLGWREIWAKIPGSTLLCPIEILLWARIGKFPCVLPNFNPTMRGYYMLQVICEQICSIFLRMGVLLILFCMSNGEAAGKIGQRKPANSVISLSSAQAKICFGHR